MLVPASRLTMLMISLIFILSGVAAIAEDYIVVEAESAAQMDPGVTVLEMDGASGGKAIDSAGDALAVHEIDFPSAGTWYVWIRAYFPDGSRDSYWIGMDDAEPNPHDSAGGPGAVKIYSEAGDSVNTAAQPFNIWYWDAGVAGEPPANRYFDVKEAGKHTLWSKGREAGSILDQILLTMDASFNAEEMSQGGIIEPLTAVNPEEGLAVTWGHIKAH